MYTDIGLSKSNFQFTGKPGANHYHMGIMRGTSKQKLDTPRINCTWLSQGTISFWITPPIHDVDRILPLSGSKYRFCIFFIYIHIQISLSFSLYKYISIYIYLYIHQSIYQTSSSPTQKGNFQRWSITTWADFFQRSTKPCCLGDFVGGHKSNYPI